MPERRYKKMERFFKNIFYFDLFGSRQNKTFVSCEMKTEKKMSMPSEPLNTDERTRRRPMRNWQFANNGHFLAAKVGSKGRYLHILAASLTRRVRLDERFRAWGNWKLASRAVTPFDGGHYCERLL